MAKRDYTAGPRRRAMGPKVPMISIALVAVAAIAALFFLSGRSRALSAVPGDFIGVVVMVLGLIASAALVVSLLRLARRDDGDAASRFGQPRQASADDAEKPDQDQAPRP